LAQITYGGSGPPQADVLNWGLVGTSIALVGLYFTAQCFLLYVHHVHLRFFEPNTEIHRSKSYLVKLAHAVSENPGFSIGKQSEATWHKNALENGGKDVDVALELAEIKAQVRAHIHS
jgi:hypothetical protein